ncbi:MAG: hypothetical protein JSR78_17065 [Proteobacteria bacterium]|nr:hypothetical protein [Pseudomonadota bacterium]
MGIIAKLNASFDATKQFSEAFAVFGVCLAIAGICALVGMVIWLADYIGAAPACFAFSGLFLLASGISKFVIDAKGREAQDKLKSAKNEAVDDVSAITQPLKIADKVASGDVSPVLSIVLFASMMCVAYFMRDRTIE